jgi:deoxyribose-phosphate aldolase
MTIRDYGQLPRRQLAQHIQFTNVSPSATREEVVAHVERCAEYKLDAAMVSMYWAPLARDILRGSGVKTATCFSLGYGGESIQGKVALLQECFRLGADEVDYEPHMGLYLSGMYAEFQEEAAALARVAEQRPFKVMLELGYLKTEEQKRHAASLLVEAGVPWIKNSSGWGPGSVPATPEDIRLLCEVCAGSSSQVKASGKINSYDKAVALLNAGAKLLGTSHAAAILGLAETAVQPTADPTYQY